jgi:hypothetical protein
MMRTATVVAWRRGYGYFRGVCKKEISMNFKASTAIMTMVFLNGCALFNGISRPTSQYRFDDREKAVLYGSAESGFFGKSNIRLRSNADKAKETIISTVDGKHFILSVGAGFYTLQVDNTKCTYSAPIGGSTIGGGSCEDAYENYGGTTMRFKPGHVYYIGHLTSAGEGSYIKFESDKPEADGWAKANYPFFPVDKSETYEDR